MPANKWFDVDKEGLAKILERKGGKSFVLFELLQNAWDEDCSTVRLTLEPQPNRPVCYIEIIDDSPNGFVNLRDAFTLFAESKKKSNAEKRGRFNLGEKLVLACCRWARVVSTTGGVEFKEDGTRSTLKKRYALGTCFEAEISMTRTEYEQACNDIYTLIPPANIDTFFNNILLSCREPLTTFEASLLTEISDENGNLKRTTRKTKVEVFEAEEVGYIYEMGIPVVETGDSYHLNIMQKVPISLERDNVPPAYLRKLRTHTLNATYHLIKDDEESNQAWVRDALEDNDCKPEAVANVVEKRFGKKAVAFDPSDIEGSHIAASKGYTVIPGAAFSKKAWKKIKESGSLKPAGQVTPSPKPYSPDGESLRIIPREAYTSGMIMLEKYVQLVSKCILNKKVPIIFTNDPDWGFRGTYGRSSPLVINLGSFQKDFDKNFCKNIEILDEFLLHEFAHEFVSNHLDEGYHKACTRLGAKLKQAVMSNADEFKQYI